MSVLSVSLRSAAALATVLALAPAAPKAMAWTLDDPSALRAAGDICQSAMGLRPGQAQYEACAESLQGSAQTEARGQALDMARRGCSASGARGADLYECELQSARQPGAFTRPAGRGAPAASSYFGASPEDRFDRSQTACARLGLDPASGAFAQCVAGLQSNLFSVDNSAQ